MSSQNAELGSMLDKPLPKVQVPNYHVLIPAAQAGVGSSRQGFYPAYEVPLLNRLHAPSLNGRELVANPLPRVPSADKRDRFAGMRTTGIMDLDSEFDRLRAKYKSYRDGNDQEVIVFDLVYPTRKAFAHAAQLEYPDLFGAPATVASQAAAVPQAPADLNLPSGDDGGDEGGDTADPSDDLDENAPLGDEKRQAAIETLQDLKHIGAVGAAALYDAGHQTIDDVAQMSIEELDETVPRLGAERAAETSEDAVSRMLD